MTVNSTAADQETKDVWTVQRVLEWTTDYLKRQGSDTPRLDTELLLAHARQCRRIELYTHFEDELTTEQRTTMRELVKRRSQAEPVAYLIGHREFFSLDFHVTPDVLIPRPDTETLVVELLERAKGHTAPRILDIGTGSGCIVIAAAVHCPDARLTAVDVDPQALAVAQENAQRHAVADRISFLQSDLFSALCGEETSDMGKNHDATDGRFGFIVSNPPYVSEADYAALEPDVRLHEPRIALDGGPDGLQCFRRLLSQAPSFLAPGGTLLVEISPEQTESMRRLAEQVDGFDEPKFVKDLAGRERVLVVQASGRVDPRHE